MKLMVKLLLPLAALAVAGSAQATVYDPDKVGDPRVGYEYRFTVPRGSAMRLCENVKLSKVTGLRGNLWLFHSNKPIPWLFTCEGPLEPTADKEGVYHWRYDAAAGTATCEFQGKWSYAYLMVVTLKLTQVGADVYAEVVGTTYPWSSPYGYEVGTNMGGEAYYEGLNHLPKGPMVQMSLHNVELDSVPEGETRNVKFYGRDGQLLKEEDVEYGEGATAPTPPEVEGYVFWKWDADFSFIKEDLVAHALYHQVFTVTFKDRDGTVLKAVSVEETKGAEAPDMAGREGFVGWDADFDCVTADMVVTAVYGTIPEEVTTAAETGVFEKEPKALVWCGAEGGWYTKDGVASKWKEGAAAVFVKDTAFTVAGTMEVGKVLLLAAAKSVSFTGDALTLVAPAEVQVPAAGRVRFETSIAGESGFALNGADATAAVEFAGDYAARGRLAVNSGRIQVVGEGTLFGGVWKASGARCESPLYIGDESVFEYNSSAAQSFATLLNATNEGDQYASIKKFVTTGRFVVGREARKVTFECSSEGLHRFYNGVDVYGEATFAKGLYHLFHENTYGVTIHDGGVLNAFEGYDRYGHRGLSLACLRGGTVNYRCARSMGISDEKATFDGGTANFMEDYSDKAGEDSFHRNVVLKNGATLTGEMMTWCAADVTDGKVSVEGSEPSVISVGKIRVGQKTANDDNRKMRTVLVVNDVTGDERADLTVSSTMIRNGLTGTNDDKNLGLVKEGAGKVLFTGRSEDYRASLALKSGAVAFGPSSALAATKLILLGDAEIEAARGASVVFADSSSAAWEEGRTLTFSGDMGRKAVRIGTDANGLTAAQLAQIRYRKEGGKCVPMTLSSEGYLLPPTKGLRVIVN